MTFLVRSLLLLYPSSWRAEYGQQMLSVFKTRRRQTRGIFAHLLLLLELIPDLLLNAVPVQLDVLSQDLRHALGTLRRSPGFTASAIAIAALGIGATTAAFSMMDHVFLQPLPFPHQNRLVKLREDDLRGTYRFWETSPANYRDWKRLSTCFETLGAYRSLSINVSGTEGEPQRVDGASLTSEILPLLGIRPVVGRMFTAQDDSATSAPTVILSYSLWEKQFSGSPSVLGRTLELDRVPYTIIGVMPKTFYFPDRESYLWTPMRWAADDFSDRRNTYIFPVGLLKPGVSLDAARAEMRTIATRVARMDPDELRDVGIAVLSFRDFLPATRRVMLMALLGAALCVLLIACTNLANLLLARAMLRRRELAVRTALGAGRERLIRQVLTESLVLAIPGGVLGLALARAALPLLVRLVPDSLPMSELPTLDANVLLFTLAVTFATGIGFGVLPALRTGANTTSDLSEGGRSGMAARRERLRGSLVVTEVACAVILLAGCGLLARALGRVRATDPGFRPDHVLTMRTQLPMPRYEKTETRQPFYAHVLDQVRTVPGVTSAAYVSFLPLAMGGGVWPVEIQGHPESVNDRRTASIRFVTPGYFTTMKIPFLSGRDVRLADTNSAPYVAIVSRSFVNRYWHDQNPIGHSINIGNNDRRVIGVVGDVLTRGLERESEPQVYASWQQPNNIAEWYAPKDLVIRTSGDPDSLVPIVRRIIHSADPAQAISDIRTLSEIVEEQTSTRRVELAALIAFGTIALLLAAVGIHAVLAFAVASRRQEIGVRMALGANQSDILCMTLAEGIKLSAIGIVIGIVLAYGVGRLLQSLLAGVSPWDVQTLAAAVAVALATAIAASLLPAIRGAHVDPMTAIRSE